MVKSQEELHEELSNDVAEFLLYIETYFNVKANCTVIVRLDTKDEEEEDIYFIMSNDTPQKLKELIAKVDLKPDEAEHFIDDRWKRVN